ncbi:hypothetical protein B0H19DRAFT_1377893 [Mycena capillaripes]|nr:hypothetical protein B0H19DRAFT_1377893 [Mycena capillaripes]
MGFKFFHRPTMRSLSTFAALFACFVLAVNATVKPAPEIGSVFAVYPGWDMIATAEPSSPITNGTEIHCLQACQASPACRAYVYVPYGDPNNADKGPGACWLKDTIILGDFVKPKFVANAGLLGPCGTFSPVGPTSCYNVTA